VTVFTSVYKVGETVEQTSSLWCLRLRHGPRWNAARAALTAFSTSATSASETWQISAAVAGSMVVAETATWRSDGCDITEFICETPFGGPS
jgi:hypothetical protein